MNKKITYGLIAGVIYAILTFGLYLLGFKVFAGPAKMLPYAVAWILLVYFAIQIRKEEGGFISYKEAVLSLFIMYIFTELVYTLFIYLLYNFIDPELSNNLKELAITQLETTVEKLGLSGEQVEEAIAKIEEQDLTFTLGRALQSWLMWSGIGIIWSLILGFIVRKQRPIFE